MYAKMLSVDEFQFLTFLPARQLLVSSRVRVLYWQVLGAHTASLQ